MFFELNAQHAIQKKFCKDKLSAESKNPENNSLMTQDGILL